MSDDKEAQEQQAAKTAILQMNFKFIMMLVFIPVTILIVTLGISFVFVAVMTGELPNTEAITQIVKDLLDFIVSLLGAMLG